MQVAPPAARFADRWPTLTLRSAASLLGRQRSDPSGAWQARAGALVVLAAVVAACTTPSSDAEITVSTVTTPPTSVPVVVPSEVTDPSTSAVAVTTESDQPSVDATTTTAPVQDVVEAEAFIPSDFPLVGVRVTKPDGETCDVCMWLADTAQRRSRGLMNVTSLGGAAGMVFAFDQPTDGGFFMFQTPTPLEIHWISEAGAVVATAEMEPCLEGPSRDCERYRPGAEYLLAVETFIGGAEAIGLSRDARVELIDASVVCADLANA